MPESDAPFNLVVQDLGYMPYVAAWAIQKDLQQQVIASRESAGPRSMWLLLVEHDPPVITISRRPGAREHLIATPEQLAAKGVEVCETDRGGDITCHGPGQLVAYPILDLNVFGLKLHSYMRLLEQVVIDTLATFGIEGHRDPEATGVWVNRSKAQGLPSLGFDAATSSKIAALGVRVSRWVSMHGLALNVDPDLSHFDLIVPCGLAGRSVTSMKMQLNDACPSMAETKRLLVSAFDDRLSTLAAR